MVTILGPTATGKTALAARLAYELGGEVISADSRQVYRGMDIGTGKDIGEYLVDGVAVPFHLIDIAEPGYEYNIFEYQQDFLKVYRDILERNRLPILCGGSGMYLEAVLKGYRLQKVMNEEELASELQEKTDEELAGILKSAKTLHNITDFENRARLLKAILVARAEESSKPGSGSSPGQAAPFPVIRSTVIGIAYPRDIQMARIAERLDFRLEHGMITEVEELLRQGISPERLMKYGLEYRYVTLFLTGGLTRAGMFFSLNIAIRQFAKRQMTWFRRMERQGMKIHWIDGRLPVENKIEQIRFLIKR
ncbi:MAG: tRNA (adenosine(37)-N6)-dimethylallyltransferase MiaA [Bacteroidota bacterium]